MRRERLKRILNLIASVTTGTLIACMVWHGITVISSGGDIREAQVPYLILPQVLLLGILCGVESELIMPGVERRPKESWLRYVLHYATVTATALICGYFFGWYEPNFFEILLMCLTSVGIYVFASYLKYHRGKKDADAMNVCLKEIQENGKGML